ncbi:MAG: type 4a pilus biogenesis protein PilO [Gammaproteobacteria bacterium]|nr:type 4a pilus biogenesis protein PilO [Gammaproteobacteria bacterium]
MSDKPVMVADTVAVSAVNMPTPLAESRIATFKSATSAIVPYASYYADRIGRTGVVGLSLCVLSLVAFVSANMPLRQQVAEQAAVLEAARLHAAESTSGSVAISPGQEAAQFVRQLPSVDDLPLVMGSIVSIAATTGIELERGSYEYIEADGAGIARYEMSLPVIGTYPEVRQFVENVLASNSAIALEGMRIERSKVSEQRISADLRFTVLLGGTS